MAPIIGDNSSNPHPFGIGGFLTLVMYGEIPYMFCEVITVPQSHESPMSHMDARIPLSVRKTIDRAAALQGRARTNFLIEAALEKAEQVIAEQTIIRWWTPKARSLPSSMKDCFFSAYLKILMYFGYLERMLRNS